MPGSAAERAGIRSGSLIQEVNRRKVLNVKEFRQALGQKHDDQGVLLLVKEGSFSRFVVLHAE
jgi:serine protease Do